MQVLKGISTSFSTWQGSLEGFFSVEDSDEALGEEG